MSAPSAMLVTLLAGVALFAGPAAAQYPAGATVQPLARADDAGERLAAALRTLSTNPADLGALIAAGRNALLLGDANAAVGFFGRADQISPRDGRVKAGLGAALVQFERPADALRLFAQASALGVPDAEFASDRGLAHDLAGDSMAAQRDYRTALAAKPDDDVARRRLALSQGIAGDRGQAIATLDPLIRRRDIAAWRAQTFVLAMTGDAAGANAITRVMLPQQQAALQPFLVRLAALSPADKARAVHFGEMPSTAVPYAQSAPYPQTAAVARAPIPAPTAAFARPSDLAPATSPSAVVTRAPAPVAVLPAPVLAPRAPTPAAALPPASRPAPQPPVQNAVAAPLPAPVQTAQAQATAKPSPTSATATQRYVRRSRDWRDVFALGLPAYEYVPLRDIALSPRRDRLDLTTAFREPLGRRHRVQPATQAAASPPAQPTVATPVPVPPPVVASSAVAPSAPPAAPAVPAPTSVAPVSIATAPSTQATDLMVPASAPTPPPAAVAAASPVASPPVASAQPPALPGLPLASSASIGHYDLPHAATPHRSAVHTMPSAPKAIAAPIEIARAEPDVPAARSSRTGDRRRPGVFADGLDARRDRHDAKTEDSEASPATKRPGRDAGSKRGKDERARADDGTGAASDTAGASSAKTKRNGDGTSRKTTASRDGTEKRPAKGPHRDSDDDKPATKARSREAEAAASHVYVQVAGGANKSDLGKAWAGIRRQAPELTKGKTPSSTPLKATNRLLVGPFEDEGAAQAYVNKMAGKGVSGFVFKSAKGQKIERIDTGG